MDTNSKNILAFFIEKQRFAIYLHSVERVIRAQAITKITDSPLFIEGVIDYYGEIIAVINLRKRLGFQLNELSISDRFIIVKTNSRKLALIVDEVEDVIIPDTKDLFDSKEIDAGMKFINILRDDEGIVLVYDVEKLLSKTEEIDLDAILESHVSLSS